VTTYTPIGDNQVDVDSPVNVELMTALRDNPLAMFEGSSGAPVLALAALGPVTAGSVTRYQDTATITASSTSYTYGNQFWSSHSGTIRFRTTSSGGSAGGTVQIIKNGVQYTSYAAGGSVDTDIPVAIGDKFQFGVRNNTGSPTTSASISNQEMRTNGEVLWPLNWSKYTPG